MKAHKRNFLFSISASVTSAINRRHKFFTKPLLILVAMIVMSRTHHAYAQLLDDYNNTPVLKADTIIWYGLDLSHMKINEPAKLSEGEKIKGHLPELLALTNKHYGTKWFSKRIINRFVVSDVEFVQSLWTTVNEKRLMTNQPFNFPDDTISSFVKSYKLAQSKGIGVVLIIENFDKPTKRVAGYFTFFDISTGEILDIMKAKGKAGPPGLTVVEAEVLCLIPKHAVIMEALCVAQVYLSITTTLRIPTIATSIKSRKSIISSTTQKTLIHRFLNCEHL